MRNDPSGEDPLRARLKHFIVGTLNLSDVKADRISDDEPLVGGRIGLDSLDALELSMGLEEEFGITIRTGGESRAALANIASLAEFIRAQVRGEGDLTVRETPQAMRVSA
jgi:acyl carrier protein